jgi:uncharacterized protein (TIGR02266 family)
MERRRYHRNKIKVMIDFLDGSDMETGYTRDISTGGMFVETGRVSKAGNTVFLDFYLPGVRKKFKLKGKVVWFDRGKPMEQSEHTGMGIEFISLDDINKADLKTGLKNIREEYESK